MCVYSARFAASPRTSSAEIRADFARRGHRPAVCADAVPGFFPATRYLPARQSAGNVHAGCALGPDLLVADRAQLCAAAQSFEALCRTPGRSTGLEVSQQDGAGRTYALLRACHLLVPVCLRTHEPVYRSLVLAAGGGVARRIRAGGCPARTVCGRECAR